MIRVPAALASLSLLLLPSIALADPYADFLNVCVAADGDRDVSEPAARAAGFIDADAATAQAMTFPDFPQSLVLSRGEGDAAEVLVIGAAPPEDFQGLTATVCLLISPEIEPEAARRRLEAAVGFPAFDRSNGAPVWYLSGEAGSWRSEPQLLGSSDEQIARVARERPVSIFAVTPAPIGGLMHGTLR